MKNIINRSVVICFGLLTIGITTAAFGQKNEMLFPGSPGIESYTYRAEFTKDVAATLDMVKANGITDIEFSNLYGQKPEDLRRMLDERGLKCSSFGTGWNNIMNRTHEVANAAKVLGARYIHLGSIPQAGPTFTLQDAQVAIAEFARVGKILKGTYDLQLLCHNHGVEFVPYGNGTLYDHLIKQTDPDQVSFELDILWAYLPGQDPAKLIDTYPTRIKALHVKDLKIGIPKTSSGKTDHDNNVVLGQGQIDIPAVIRAAKKAKIEHYYLEDESRYAVEQVPQSIKYLRSLKK